MISRLLVAAALLSGCGATQKRETAAAPAPAPAPAPEEKSPAPTDDIRIEGELGTLEPAQIEGPFKRSGSAITACYQKGIDEVWYLGGAIELKLRVTREGAVKTALVQRPLGHYEVERCLLGVARGLKFPPPRGNAEAEFTYSLQFRGKAALREWGTTEVGSVFAKRRAGLDACARKGNAPPSLRVTFFVGPHGAVGAVGVGGDGAIDEAYGRCVAGEVRRWKFEDPRGKVARATYEF